MKICQKKEKIKRYEPRKERILRIQQQVKAINRTYVLDKKTEEATS